LLAKKENTNKFNGTHEESSYENCKGQMNKGTEKEARATNHTLITNKNRRKIRRQRMKV
jgi:hypothetical protein